MDAEGLLEDQSSGDAAVLLAVVSLRTRAAATLQPLMWALARDTGRTGCWAMALKDAWLERVTKCSTCSCKSVGVDTGYRGTLGSGLYVQIMSTWTTTSASNPPHVYFGPG